MVGKEELKDIGVLHIEWYLKNSDADRIICHSTVQRS